MALSTRVLHRAAALPAALAAAAACAVPGGGPEAANERVVRAFLEEVVNTGNVDDLDRYVAEDYTEVYEGERFAVGLEGARQHVLGGRRTYPDLHLTIERQIAAGEWVATVWTARGTHAGEWLGIAPTGRQIVMRGVNVDRVVGGRIVEHGGAANVLEAMLRVGAVQVVGDGR